MVFDGYSQFAVEVGQAAEVEVVLAEELINAHRLFRHSGGPENIGLSVREVLFLGKSDELVKTEIFLCELLLM